MYINIQQWQIIRRKMIALYIWLGIYVTEDFSSKNSRQVQQEKIWKDGPLAAVPGGPGKLDMHTNMIIQ